MSLHRGNIDPDQIQHPDDTGKFLRGDATWAAPAGSTSSFWGVSSFSTPPSTWTWVNQGGASMVVNTGGSVYLTGPAGAGASLRQLVQTAPATPYTITICFLAQLVGSISNAGLEFRESSSGKIITIEVAANSNAPSGNSILVTRWTNSTTFSANQFNAFALPGDPIWFRIHADGTNITFSVSVDGQNWLQVYSEAKNAFFTTAPDQVGIFVDIETNTNGFSASMTLLSWAQT